MLDKKVWTPVLRCKLTDAQQMGVIRSSMFLKRKANPDGTFDKGQAFLLTASFIMGLLMITHLGPINTSSQLLPTKTRDQVGLSLLDHCDR
jgi:hypothetical protein